MKIGLAVAVLAAALFVRLHEINQPLVTFRAIRHYRSAIIARAFYYHAASGIPTWAVQVADANHNIQQAGEPPLMEWLACASYLAVGHENVAIPRAYAALAWVLGAIPLFFLARRVGSPRGALLAGALYLFLPYGIIASRNFQPDALMTLASLCALVALVRHDEQPTAGRRFLAVTLVGLAMLIKPMSIFLTVPALIGLHIARYGWSRLIAWPWREVRELSLSFFLCLVPALVYYGYGALFGNFVRDQMHMRFVPHLLVTSFFWSGILTQIGRVFTMPLFVIAILGTVVAPRPAGRVLLASLWVGWAAFCVAFTYHMPTHDYYHWPYIAAVSLGAAALLSKLEQAILGLNLAVEDRVAQRAILAAVVVGCVAIAVLGTKAAWPRLHVPDADDTLDQYREIGVLTAHDTRVLFLDPEYGYPLMYHAEVSGDTWPNQDDLAAEALGGAEALNASARWDRDYAGFDPHYFVVTDLDSLRGQPDLQALLAERATVVQKTGDFHVYKFKSQ